MFTRKITGHETNPCNEAITIEADERDAQNGNTSHCYFLSWLNGGAGHGLRLDFQAGPIAEAGVNGLTNEALLVVLIDRFEGFQSSPHACEENEWALHGLRFALAAMRCRTRERIARGVEGTHAV